MPISDKYRPQFTFEDFHMWGGRWELIDGMPYFTKQEPAHQLINAYLLKLFDKALEKNCDKCKVYLPIGWKIDNKSVVQPDILVIHKDIGKNKHYLEFTP